MKFYKLSNSIYKDCEINVKLKTEYFWHYWDFLFTEYRDLVLFDEPKFTSQISQINKIEKHLEWNNGINFKKLHKYFNHHLYFDKKNIILRGNVELTEKITDIKRFIESKNDNLSADNREYLKGEFKALRTGFFELNSYSTIIINILIKVIFNSKELNDNSKGDLKFLCNTIIDLFILRGYSLAFIKELLNNTIFSTSNKFNFKYEKNYSDFSTYEGWKEYELKQFELLSFKDRFDYLKIFLNKPKRKGFYIFKIEGIDFQSDPMEVFGTKFYNPEKDKVLNFYKSKNSKIKEEDYEYYINCELFNGKNSNLNFHNSNCNLIVPTEYNTEDINHFDSFKFPTKSFIEAKDKAKVSLLEFKRLIKSFSIEYFFDEGLANIRVSNNCILVDENYNYHKLSSSKGSKKVVFKLDEIRKKMAFEQLEFKTNIDFKNSFSVHLASSNALISKYKLEYHKFNFKSLWIECIEPYFKDTEEFIDYAKKTIRIRGYFFSNYRILLMNALSDNLSTYPAYCLDKVRLNELGIGELRIGEMINGDELENKFELLPCDSMLCEFKDEMRLFEQNESEFLSKIDSWITKTIRVAYDERNIEVHYNLVDYYNDISIKRDVLLLIKYIIGALNDSVFSENVKSAIEAKRFIDKNYLIQVNKS